MELEVEPLNPLFKSVLARPVSIYILFFAILVFGTLSGLQLPQGMYPNLVLPKLVVTAEWPGVPPEEIRRNLLIPLEDGLSSVVGMESMVSIARPGMALVELTFFWGTDLMLAGVRTRELIDEIHPQLPNDALKPTVLTFDPNQEALLILGVSSDTIPHHLLREMVEKEVRTEIQQLQGVGSVTIQGGRKDEVVVDLDPYRLTGVGLNPSNILEWMQTQHQDYPIGTVTEEGTDYIVKILSEIRSLQELENLMVPTQGGEIPLATLGSVSFQPQKPRSVFWANGRETLGLVVRRAPGSSPVQVADRVRTALPRISANYRGAITLSILSDLSIPVRSTVAGLFLNLALGAGAAFLVLYAMLRTFHSAVLVSLAIPASLLGTLLLMFSTGMTLNIVSLMGLTIAVGMLVDNSVVIVERLEQKNAGRNLLTTDQLAQTVAEVASSSLPSTLTTIAVFLPLLFLPGLFGAVYRDLSLTVTFGISCSFFVSVTLVPSLYAAWPRSPTTKTQSHSVPVFYTGFLHFLSRHRKIFYLAFVAALLLLLPLFSLSTFRLFQTEPGNRLNAVLRLPAGLPLEEGMDVLSPLFVSISNQPQFITVLAYAGIERDDYQALGNLNRRREDFYLEMEVREGVPPESAKTFLTNLFAQTGLDVTLEFAPNPLMTLLGLGNENMTTVFQTSNFDLYEKDRAWLETELRNSGAQNLQINPPAGYLNYELQPRWDQLHRLGLSPNSLSQILFVALEGGTINRLKLGNSEYDFRIRQEEITVESLEQMMGTPIALAEGKRTVLSEIVTVQSKSTYEFLVRHNRRDSIPVISSARDVALLKPSQANWLTRGYTVYSPEVRIFQQNLFSIVAILALSVVILYLLLAFSFQSFLDPLIVLSILPFTLIGALSVALLQGKPFTLNAFFSILVLFGTGVNSAIILRETIVGLYRRKKTSLSVIVAGCRSWRPIWMTTLTTVIALLPSGLGFATTPDQSMLAWMLIVGLLLSSGASLAVITGLSFKNVH